MKNDHDLINNINKLHTTPLGMVRIQRNLALETSDAVSWCKRVIKKANNISKKGKNWYASAGDVVITINVHSYTIITAHKG